MLLDETSQDSVNSVATVSSDDNEDEIAAESSIHILYPLVGLCTIAASLGLLAFGIRDTAFHRTFHIGLGHFDAEAGISIIGINASSCGQHKNSKSNGRLPRHRELFAKRTTNRRKRQNAENMEQREALKEEVTTPTQDPRDYEACKRNVFRLIGSGGLRTQCPTLNDPKLSIATILKE